MIYTAPRQRLFALIILTSFCLHTALLVVSTEQQITDSREQKGERLITQLVSDSALALRYKDRVSLSVIANRYANEFDVNRIIIRDVDGEILVQTGDAPLQEGTIIDKLATRDKTVIGNIELIMRSSSKGEIIKMLWLFILGSLIMHFFIWLIYGRVARPTQEQLQALSREIYEHYFACQNDIKENHKIKLENDTSDSLMSHSKVDKHQMTESIDEKENTALYTSLSNQNYSTLSTNEKHEIENNKKEESNTLDLIKRKTKLFSKLFTKKNQQQKNPKKSKEPNATFDNKNNKFKQINDSDNSAQTNKQEFDKPEAEEIKQTNSTSSQTLSADEHAHIIPRVLTVYTSPESVTKTNPLHSTEHNSSHTSSNNPLMTKAKTSKNGEPLEETQSASYNSSQSFSTKTANINHDLSRFLSTQQESDNEKNLFTIQNSSEDVDNPIKIQLNTEDNVEVEIAEQQYLIPETVQIQIKYIDKFNLLNKLSPTAADSYFKLCGQLLKQASVELFKQPSFRNVTLNNQPVFNIDGTTIELQHKDGNQHSLTLAAVMLAELYKMLNEIVYNKHRELGRFAFSVAVGVSQAGRENAMKKLLEHKAEAHDVMMLLAKNELSHIEKHMQLKHFDRPSNVSERECAYVQQPNPINLQVLTQVRNAVLKVED